MRALQELAWIVHNNRMTSVEFVNNKVEKDAPVQEFYEGLIRGEFNDDQTAADKVGIGDKNSTAYQTLKRQVRQGLLNSVFFFDLSRAEYNDRQKAYFTVYKDWAAAKVLLGKNAYHIGIELCNKVLKLAEKFEFTDLMVDILRILRLHAGTREGNLKKYEEYNALFKRYEQIYYEENRSEEFYTELVLHYVNSRANAEETSARAREVLAELEGPLRQHETYRLPLGGMLLKLQLYSSQRDLEKTIEVCEEYLKFFLAKPYDAAVPIQICYYQELICYTQLKNFEEGKRVAEQCLRYLEEGTFNWFKYQELFFVLSMHTGKYQDAYDVFVNTVEHRRFRFLPPSVVEVWKIHEAYIYYLISLGYITPGEDDSTFSRFRVSRFTNDTPIFSRDKRGMNISILVLQVLFMIQQRKYDQAVDRMEAIEKYCTRYLRQDDTFRSNCFIKMLLLIPANGFHKAAVTRKADKYLRKLKETPLDMSSQSYEIEVIPYEQLWEMAIGTLENNFRQIGGRKKKE